MGVWSVKRWKPVQSTAKYINSKTKTCERYQKKAVLYQDVDQSALCEAVTLESWSQSIHTALCTAEPLQYNMKVQIKLIYKTHEQLEEVNNMTPFPLPVQTNITWLALGRILHKIMTTCCQRFFKAVTLTELQMMKWISAVACSSLNTSTVTRMNARQEL